MQDKHLTITPHAEIRWRQRVDEPAVDLRELWEESVPVGAPSDTNIHGKIRLHEPADALLVYDRANEDKERYILKTVLRASRSGMVPEDYNTEHLRYCVKCTFLWDPARSDSCHWCELPRIRNDYDHETVERYLNP